MFHRVQVASVDKSLPWCDGSKIQTCSISKPKLCCQLKSKKVQ